MNQQAINVYHKPLVSSNLCIIFQWAINLINAEVQTTTSAIAFIFPWSTHPPNRPHGATFQRHRPWCGGNWWGGGYQQRRQPWRLPAGSAGRQGQGGRRRRTFAVGWNPAFPPGVGVRQKPTVWRILLVCTTTVIRGTGCNTGLHTVASPVKCKVQH